MKNKTHKSMKKRIRISGTGKFMRRRSHTSHYKLAKGSNTWARLKRDVEASKGDIKKIRELLDKKVFNDFNEALKERKTKGLTSETTFIGINSANIKNYKQINNMFEVTVDFVSEIISCVKDKDKKLISGSPEKIKKVYDTWKFSRDIKSISPNWLLIDTQA